MKILYINAITTQRSGEILGEGLLRGLLQSKRAERGDPIELINFDIFYGKKYSPRLMGVFARNHDVDAVVLSGSEKNTTDKDDPWIQDYFLGLKDLLELRHNLDDWTGPKTPIFGICFGHQALACVLGGETARFKLRNDVLPLKPLALAHEHALFKPMLKKGNAPLSQINAAVYHADHVVRLPQGFHQLFTSDYCDIQGMAHDQWPIVSLQSHPEFSGLLKKDPDEAEGFKHVSEEALNSHHGPAILGRFVDWIENR